MSTEIDLDALEKEGRPGPMTIKVRGKKFETIDPLLLPWDVYEAIDWSNTRAVLKAVLIKADYDTFVSLKITQNGLNLLAGKLSEHYFGVTEGE